MTAPAPWHTLLDAIVWWHRAAPGAQAHLPPPLDRRPALALTVGALIRYRDTPVGPYHEVLGSPVLLLGGPLPAASVPFIAVDSEPSVRGGRENWALPKEPAAFAWPRSASGDGWSVDVRTRARQRRLPFAAPLRTCQVREDGTAIAFDTRARGTARAASVEVLTGGTAAPPWLRDGRHRAVVLEGARVVVGRARP